MSSTPGLVRVVTHGGHTAGGQGCINSCCCPTRFCCCFTWFSYLNFDVLQRIEAKYKITEAMLAGVIQGLLLKYGHGHSEIGFSYDTCLTTSSACLLTSLVLLTAYIMDPRSIDELRASRFELLFNSLVCILYLSSGGYLAFSVNTIMLPLSYAILSIFGSFPGLTVCYVMCFLAAVVHGTDAYKAFKI